MFINNKRNNRIQIIVACLLIAAITAGGVFFDSYAWAQPVIPQEATSEIADAEVPVSESAGHDSLPKEKLYLESEEQLMLASLNAPEQNPEPLPEGEESGFVTVGLYSSCSSVSGGAVAEMTVSCADGFFLAKVIGRGYVPDIDLRLYSVLIVKAENGVVNLYDADNNMLLTGVCADDVLMSAADDPDERIISIGSSRYRDGVMFKAESSTKMAVINFVNLEHYLWGSLNAEMSAGNPIEALKAQAVASRSFAVAHYGYHGKYGFDLCTTTNCQSYKGVSAEKDQTIRACRETEDIVLVSGGKVASGYYYASSGGYTMNSEDVWGGTISYLRAVPDPYSPLKVWNSSITFADLASRLKSKGLGVGNIESVEITSRYASGGVRSMVITGDAGSVTLTGAYNPSSKSIVSVIGSGTLQSIFFSMGGSSYPGVAIESGSGIATTSGQLSSAEAVAVNADGSTSSVDLSSAFVTGSGAAQPISGGSGKKPVYSQQIVTTSASAIYFSGIGYGHGCGLPQTSAISMANAGYTYDAILTYYYTGIQLKQLKSL